MRQFSEFLNDLSAKVGQGSLADQIGIDGGALSRFKSGQGNIGIDKLDRLFEVFDCIILPRSEWRRLQDALEVVSDLWSKERKRLYSTGKGTRREESKP